jgi:hypothetical protein
MFAIAPLEFAFAVLRVVITVLITFATTLGSEISLEP